MNNFGASEVELRRPQEIAKNKRYREHLNYLLMESGYGSNTMKDSKVHKTPAKIVDMHNKPMHNQDQVGGPEELQARMVAALRQLADGIENATMRMPERIVILPQFGTEVQLIHIGDDVPTLYLEGMLHKLVTRMALQ